MSTDQGSIFPPYRSFTKLNYRERQPRLEQASTTLVYLSCVVSLSINMGNDLCGCHRPRRCCGHSFRWLRRENRYRQDRLAGQVAGRGSPSILDMCFLCWCSAGEASSPHTDHIVFHMMTSRPAPTAQHMKFKGRSFPRLTWRSESFQVGVNRVLA